MSELNTTSENTPTRKKSIWVTLGLVVALVAIFCLSLLVAPRPESEDEEAFGGTDAQATALVEESNPDYEPWFQPIFEPGSGEVESGLFALQAAIGAGICGYAIGRLDGRRREQLADKAPASAPEPSNTTS